MKTLLNGQKFYKTETRDPMMADEGDNRLIIDVDPVETVSFNYEDDRVPVSYLKVGKNARTPRRGSAQAAGYDVYSTAYKEILPRETVYIPSDLITKPPPGWCIKLYNRSSLAAKHSIWIPGSPTVIDSDYRGNIIVPLYNFGDTTYEVKIGDRIAQGLMERCYKIRWILDPKLVEKEKTERGSGGFGSTGR